MMRQSIAIPPPARKSMGGLSITTIVFGSLSLVSRLVLMGSICLFSSYLASSAGTSLAFTTACKASVCLQYWSRWSFQDHFEAVRNRKIDSIYTNGRFVHCFEMNQKPFGEASNANTGTIHSSLSRSRKFLLMVLIYCSTFVSHTHCRILQPYGGLLFSYFISNLIIISQDSISGGLRYV